MTTPLVHTINDTCDVLQISRGSLYTLINKGELKTFNIGHRRMIAHEELVDFIERQRMAA